MSANHFPHVYSKLKCISFKRRFYLYADISSWRLCAQQAKVLTKMYIKTDWYTIISSQISNICQNLNRNCSIKFKIMNTFIALLEWWQRKVTEQFHLCTRNCFEVIRHCCILCTQRPKIWSYLPFFFFKSTIIQKSICNFQKMRPDCTKLLEFI